jgi:quercetin dioxygenase-like cupin family protein
MLKYLQIQQLFDASKMKAEVMQLEAALWQQHYNKSHYEGHWTVLPLRSLQGRIENVVSLHAGASGHSSYADTPLLERCPYLQSVLGFFACEKTAVRLMKLHAGGIIKEHRDHDMSLEEGEVRFHVPIITNPQLAFYLDGERIQMQEGECWYLNLSLPHRVDNAGDTDRVHLVIDCKVNAWIQQLFAEKAQGQVFIEGEKEEVYDKETKQKIIWELRQMNTPVALELAAKMEKEFS